MAGNSLGSAVVEFGANTATLQTDAQRAVGIVDKAVADINVSINKAGSGANFSGISSQVKGLQGDFANLQSVIGTVFGVGLGVAAVKQVMDLADEYQNVSNRIRTVTSDAQQLAAVQKQVFDVAQQTGAALDDTAKMYQRLEQSIQGSGKSQADSQAQAIALTKTLNEEIVVSGASAGEASRAIMDLVHGLSGGVLHAQQLRPIMRQMPDLARQIADGLGLSAKQFEELVKKGLPAADVLKALDAQAASIDARFNSLPKTFARAWQELHNAVEQYVGQASQASAVSDAIKNSIVGIANNIGTVATGLQDVAIATGLWLGSKTLQAIGALATGILQAVTAQGAYKTAAMASAEADVANATAQKAALAATIAQADARNDLRITEINGLNATSAALATEIANLEREALAGTNVLAATERLTAARAELNVATARTAEVEGAMAASQAKATLAEQAETVATTELTAANLRLAESQAAATGAMGLLQRGASGLLALVGGWPTLFLAAGVGVYYLVTAEDDLDKKNDELAKSLKAVQDTHGAMTPAIEKSTEAAFAQAQQIQQNIEKQLALAKSEQDASVGAYDMGGGFGDAEVKAAILSGQLQTATGIAQGLAKAFVQAKAAAAGNWLASIFTPSSADNMKALMVELEAGQDAIDKQTASMHLRNLEFGKTHVQAIQAIADDKVLKSGLTEGTKAYAEYKAAVQASIAGKLQEAAVEDRNEAAKKANTAALREQRKELTAQQQALKDYNADLLKLTDVEDQLSSGMGGPYLANLKNYQKQVDLTAKTWADAVAAGTANDELLGRLSADQEQMGKAYDDANKKIKDQHDLMATAQADLLALQAIQGVAPQFQAAITDGLKTYDTLMKSHYDFYGNYIEDENKLKEALDQQLPLYTKSKQAVNDLDAQMKLNEETAKNWIGMWVNAGNQIADTFSKVLVEGGSLMDGLVDIAKQVVEQIISQFLKLQVINPILNSIFGGQSGFTQLAVGGNGGGGLLGQFLNSGSGGSSGGFSFSDPSSWLSAGKNLWNGFAGGQAASAGSLGDFTGYGTQDLNYGGSFDFAADQGGSYASGGFDASQAGVGNTGGGFSLGQGLSVAGGIYAGYNEYQQAGGGAAGIAGGVAYGVGTYFAGTAAAAALSGGLAAGMAAIPVVGWIALAAMLIDKFSGGKLFGTAGVPTGGWASITNDQSGAYATNDIDMKGQKPLFGGADFSQDHEAGSSEQNAAAVAFFASIQKGADAFAKQFGASAGIVAAGSFSQKFDKNGKLTGETTTHINGQEYKNETQDQFAERIQAESFSQTLASIGVNITAYTGQFIQDADSYSKAVQDAAGAVQLAQADIKAGTDITGTGGGLQAAFDMAQKFDTDGDALATTYQRLSAETKDLANGVGLLTGQSTISAIEAFLATAQNAGESLTQTYQRLQQAGAQYNQFVAQFKPGPTFTDPFQASLAGINTAMKNAAAQANALAKAAGLEGASTKDLANIHAWAAQQFAQAVAQLKVDANSLASSLGYAVSNNLDQINQQIAALQGSAGGAASAFGSVGNAMQTFTQRATDQINLLLGDLSPLNDQQKLQTALAGQQVGTVTPDQVLTIARRLMGSGSDYAAIFAQVMAVGDRTQHGQSGGGGGGGSGSSGNAAQLAALIAQRDKLEEEARKQQAATLAQQIADIVSSTGETINQALTDVGIKDLAPFIKDLGLTDEKSFDDLITSLEHQADSAGDDTESLSNDITSGFGVIADLLQELINVQGGPNSGGAQTLPGQPAPIWAPPRGNRLPAPRTMGAR